MYHIRVILLSRTAMRVLAYHYCEIDLDTQVAVTVLLTIINGST